MAASHYVLTWQGEYVRTRGSGPSSLSYKDTNPIMSVLPSWPHLNLMTPKGLTSKCHHIGCWGSKIWILGWGGHKYSVSKQGVIESVKWGLATLCSPPDLTLGSRGWEGSEEKRLRVQQAGVGLCLRGCCSWIALEPARPNRRLFSEEAPRDIFQLI